MLAVEQSVIVWTVCTQPCEEQERKQKAGERVNKKSSALIYLFIHVVNLCPYAQHIQRFQLKFIQNIREIQANDDINVKIHNYKIICTKITIQVFLKTRYVVLENFC